jgi:hypothetical protein
MRPKTGQSREWLCSLFLALFSAKSGKLTSLLKSICAIGRDLLNWLAIEVMAIPSPGVVGGWGLGGLDLVVKGLAVHHFRLMGRFLVNGVG